MRPAISVAIRYLRISYLEAKSDYQGTKIGLAWAPLSTLIFTAMLALVFHHAEAGYRTVFFLYVLAGYVLWNFISESVGGSVDIIQKRLEFAVHNNLSLVGLFLKVLSDRILIYGVNSIALLLSIVILDPRLFSIQNFLIFPFLVIITLTSLSISFIINVMTIFIPDMSMLIKTGVRFVFFASPVFWLASGAEGVRGLLVTYNPVAYYLSLSRQIYGIEPVESDKWIITILITIALTTVALITYRNSHSFIRNLK
jgi:ABC-type polysaccharide/polyol phosphate export permease